MRQISQKFIDDLKSWVLAPFLEMVKVDDALCLEIGNGYITLLPRAISIRLQRQKERLQSKFDLNYCANHRDALASIGSFEVERWAENAPK